MTDARENRPWLGSCGSRPAELSFPATTMLERAQESLARRGDRPFLRYFYTAISGNEVAAASDAFAAALASRRFEPGDRLVAQLQNMPQFVIALLGTWKAGGIFVTANPMYKSREIGALLADCGAKSFLTLEELYPDVGGAAIEAGVEIRITTSPLDGIDGPLPRVLTGIERSPTLDAEDLAFLIDAHRGLPAPDVPPGDGDDVAVLIYTSGTTGPPKGATITHRNLIADNEIWRAWIELTEDDVIMAMAPVFHVTGLAANVSLALYTGAELVFGYRFDPGETLSLISKYGAGFLVGAGTAYTALMDDPSLPDTDLGCLRVTASGGAAVAPALARRWEDLTGLALQNCYGMTETTSLVLLTPTGSPPRVDTATGALSVGVPVSSTVLTILDDDGNELPAGEIGEIVVCGPTVVPGYWHKPEETSLAIPDGRLRTGDVGSMDEDGWFYLVDRRKDLIVASGFKVWPREVEDVLLEHRWVREAAVVGVEDPYRGETVKAFVSLRAGSAATEAELIAFCRERMAAYKCPRNVEIVAELPKTATGKILRRELRDES